MKIDANKLILAIVVVGSSSACLAQDFDVGKFEYQLSCASCHGLDGKGKGPVSAELKVPPTDLTVLAKKNNGVFPFRAVYEVIDGRQTVIAHGPRNMPVWGMRFAATQGSRYDPIDPEAVTRARILATIDYLNRIQQK